MLKSLESKEKMNWPRHLSKLAFSYNVTVNKSTGFAPYYLMFGRSPRLPIDSVFQVGEDETPKIPKTYKKYADEWERAMNQAFTIAKENAEKSGDYNKQHRKVRGVEIEVGDRVLLRNREKGGTGKLRNFWEDKIYVVVKKDEEIPVITIKPEAGGKEKRVHRNSLLKSNFILPEKQVSNEEQKKHKERKNCSSKSQQNKETEEKAISKPAAEAPGTAKTSSTTPTLKQSTRKTKATRIQSANHHLERTSSESEESDMEYVVVSRRENNRTVPVLEDESDALVEDEEGATLIPDVVDDQEIDSNQENTFTEEPSFSFEEGEEVPESPLEVEETLDESDNDSDNSSSDTEQRRYPCRTRNRATRMTYDTMGGNPSFTEC